MKILQVIDTLARGGGAEKFVFDLTLSLHRQGIEVEVLSITQPTEEKDKEFITCLKKQGIAVYGLNPDNHLYAVKNTYLMYRFIKQHAYDVVHVHLFPALYYAGIAARFLPGVKFVYTEHSTDNRRRHIRGMGIVEKFIYRHYQTIVCISEQVKQQLFHHIGAMRYALVHNGIYTEDFIHARPYSAQELTGETIPVRMITMVSRFSPVKDYMTLFRALKYLPEYVHVLCVGTGPLEGQHKEFCREQGFIKRVHFLGLREDINRILKSSDVIVLSSSHEGFSLSMLEAMVSGKPFVASAVPGIADLVEQHAVLFPFGDEKTLAEEIMKLLNHPAWCQQVADRCQNFALQYDISKTAGQYLEIYHKL